MAAILLSVHSPTEFASPSMGVLEYISGHVEDHSLAHPSGIPPAESLAGSNVPTNI